MRVNFYAIQSLLGVTVISVSVIKFRALLPFVLLLLPIDKMNLTVQFFTYSNEEKHSGRKRT